MNDFLEKVWIKLKQPRVFVPCIMAGIILIISGIGLGIYLDAKETERLDAVSVSFVPELKMNYDEKKKVSDFLARLDGTLVEDKEISFDEIGQREITFEYINIKNKKRAVKFVVDVVDTVAPKIYGGNYYTVNLNYGGDLTDLMMSGDEVDDNPKREIAGDYDLGKVGEYKVTYVITDASGNKTEQPFTLNVVEPSNETAPPYEAEKLPISEVIKKYRAEDTMIGIDVSQWQGEIDWERVKAAGVEFAFVRVGYQKGFGGEYVLDPYFQDNMLEATELGLPAGVYFYSYADSIDEAVRQADWVRSQIGGYGVGLGVAFDWESWGDFNQAGMSFRTINNVARAFLDEINAGNHIRSEYNTEKPGFTGLLYGSKVYLDRVWDIPEYDTWLAQYYDRVTYEGDYKFWQMSNSGQVPGIDGDVDIDIMYKR